MVDGSAGIQARQRAGGAGYVGGVLEIFLGDVFVGTIVELNGRNSVFTFDESYIANDERPILSRGFIDAYERLRVRDGALGRVLPFFANLLPEGELREYIAEHAGIDVRDELALLWVTGRDLPGAVIVRAADGREVPPLAAGAPRVIPDGDRLLRFSLAGVQLKFSAVRNAAGGLTIPISGRDGDFIVKLPSMRFAKVPVNEYAMMKFAGEVGLDVPDCQLVELDRVEGLPNDVEDMAERSAFVVRRFDRAGGKRIHMEDFNQVYRQYPPLKYDNHDYNEMARDIYRLTGVEGLRDFVHRLVFSIAIGNTDMHLKNWSLIYRDGRTAELAPVYDYLCTSAYRIYGRNSLALNIGSTKAFVAIDDATFESFAQRAGVARRIVLSAAHEMRDRIRETWPKRRPAVLEQVPSVVARIDELLARVPFFSGKPEVAAEPVDTGNEHEELA